MVANYSVISAATLRSSSGYLFINSLINVQMSRASCMQANGAKGQKDNRLRKEEKGRNLTKVNRYLQGKRGVPA